MNYPLFIVFILSFLYMLFFPALLPALKLSYFAPFIVLAGLQCTTFIYLFLALALGFFLDTFSSSTPFGFYSLIYPLSAIFLQGCRQTYIKDETVTLLLLTLFFILIESVLEKIVGFFFKLDFSINIQWILTDLIFMPLLDLIYSLILLLPIKFIQKRRKINYSK